MRAVSVALVLGCATSPAVRVATPEPCVCPVEARDCEKPVVAAITREKKAPLPEAFRQDIAEDGLKQTEFAVATAKAATGTCKRVEASTRLALDAFEPQLFVKLQAAHGFLKAPADDDAEHKILAWAMYTDAIDDVRDATASALVHAVVDDLLNDAAVEVTLGQARYYAYTQERAPYSSAKYKAFMRAVAAELLKPLAASVSRECADDAVAKRRPTWVKTFKGKH